MAAKTYTTLQGDTWDGIAYRLWGEERHMHTLMALNPDHMDTLIFSAGITLRLPDLAPASRDKTSQLPPWFATAGGRP